MDPRRYLRFLRPNTSADIDDELAFHLTERVEALVAEGHSEPEARARAVAEFGDVRAVRNGLREIDRRVERRRQHRDRLATMRQELRFAVRRLVRQPGFTVPAALTLALGLAATAVVYTLLDAVVLRPLPYPRAERLVSLSSPMPKLNDRWGLARHQLFYYKENAKTLEDLALYRFNTVTVLGDGADRHAERVGAAVVSAGIFGVLGIRPAMGRLLTSEDNLVQPPQTVVLGYDYWANRFASDPAIVGKTISVEGFPAQVVGVTAAGANLPDARVEVWLPDYVDPKMAAMNNHVRSAIGVLRPGRTAADLQRELAPLVRRMVELFPSAYGNDWIERTGFSTAVIPLRDEVVGETVTRALWIVFAAVGIVLVIAAANVANLFIVRAEARRRESAMRAALGAARGHLAFHHLSEGLLLALVAGLVAAALSAAALRLLGVLAPAGIPRLGEVRFGWTHLALLLTAALAAGIAFGLIPLAHAGVDPRVLREGGRGLTGSRRRVVLRGALVVGQVALALVLLAGAGLMLRSFDRLRHVTLGFDPEGVTTMAVALPYAQYEDYARATSFYEQLTQRLLAIPGVQNVGFSGQIPLTGKEGCSGVGVDQPGSTGVRGKCISTRQVSPGYFATMRNAVHGRAPDWNETRARAAGVVITRALANVFWPGEEALGRGVKCCGLGERYYTVVGVADDVHDAGLDEPPMQAVFFPLIPIEGSPIEERPVYMQLVVRAPGLSASALAPIVQRLVSELDPQVPIANPRSMDDVVARSMAKRTVTLMLLGVAAAMALLLSAVGLYGVISYVVGQRRGEIGIRVALGASTRRVAGLVLAQSLTLVALGVAIGLAGAAAGTRVLRGLLFEVSPTDPLVLAGVSALLISIALIATLVPTRRALRVDPLETLRAE